MPDMCMCQGKDCPMKLKCYRFKAVPNGLWQSYFTKPPFRTVNDISSHGKITTKSLRTTMINNFECEYFDEDDGIRRVQEEFN